MALESLNCPNCGARLQIGSDQTLVVCAYCNSNIRLTAPAAGHVRLATAEINWKIVAELPDKRRFVSDGVILLDLHYVRLAALPAKTVSTQALTTLLASPTTHTFNLSDLTPSSPLGHYQGPHGLLLNKRYIDILRQVEPAYGALCLRGRGPLDPIIICDGEAVIGVFMPMKP